MKAFDASDRMLVQVDLGHIFRGVVAQYNYIFIVDVSASMSDDIQYMKDILKTWLMRVDLGCGLAFVAFSNSADVVFMTKCLDEASRKVGISRLQTLEVVGQTNVELGIRTALHTQGQMNASLPSRVVLLTDGKANAGEQDPNNLAALMTTLDSKIDIVMLTKHSSVPFTEAVKTLSNENSAYFAKNGDDLTTVFNNIVGTFGRHPVHVNVNSVKKIIPVHVSASSIDLLFDVPPSSNPSITISIDIHGVHTELLDNTFLETHDYMEANQLNNMVKVALALQRLGSVKTDIVTKKENANFQMASETLDDISKILDEVKLDTDVTDTVSYRSLCAEHSELTEITKLCCCKDPGECPVTYTTKVVEQSNSSYCYRSLRAEPVSVRVFNSVADEHAYNQWLQDTIAYTQTPTRHMLSALKPTCA